MGDGRQVDSGRSAVDSGSSLSVAGLLIHEPAHNIVWELDTAVDDTFAVSTGTHAVLVHNCDYPPPTTVNAAELFPQSKGITDYEERLVRELIRREGELGAGDFDEDTIRNQVLKSLDDHQIHHVLPQNVPNRSFLDQLGIDINNPQNLKPLPCNGTTCANLPTRQGSHSNYSEAVGEMLGRIQNSGATQEAQQRMVDSLLIRAHEGLSGDLPLRNTDGALAEDWVAYLESSI